MTDTEAELLNIGHEYPLGYDYFRTRLHRAFSSQVHLQHEDEIRKGIARAEFVKKGLSIMQTNTGLKLTDFAMQKSRQCEFFADYYT